VKKLSAITLAITVLFGSTFNSIHAFADSKDDLQDIQKQRQNIKENLSGAQAKIESIMSEIDDMNEEIERVNEEISKKQELIDETDTKIKDTIQEIGELQQEIEELQDDIQKRQEVLEKRMSSYQKSGGAISYLDVLFGAQNFSDFISRVTMVSTISESDGKLIEQLDSDIKTVEEKKQESLNKLDELNNLRADQENMLSAIQEKKLENENSKQALQNKQSDLLAFINNLKSKDSSLAKVESDVKASIEAEEAQKARELEQTSSESSQAVKQVEGKTITVTATAYTASCKGCSGYTKTGINLKDNPNAKVIAVDPSVIPLGSVVYVEGYGYAIAGDVGSAIKGNRIDVFVPSHSQAIKWGVRKVKVTIQ
jgi:peptidoglycan DL-endopeptidase CwlO